MNEERARHIAQARVYLRESRARRTNPVQRGFTFLLLEWARAARLRAAAVPRGLTQGELFE